MKSGGPCRRVDWAAPVPDQSVSWVCGALGLRTGRRLAITELRDWLELVSAWELDCDKQPPPLRLARIPIR